MSGWLLILALLLLGGGLAVTGDRLGTRIGKARLSFFRMRPRRTAMVFTAITGSLISALSFAVLITVNDRWRRGLFQLGRIEKSLRTTREDLNTTQKTLESVQEALVTSHEALVYTDRNRVQAEAQVQQLREHTGTLQAQTQELQQDIHVLDGQRQQLWNEQALLTETVRRRDQQVAALQEQIKSQVNTLHGLRRSVTALRRGDVTITRNEPLAMAKVALPHPDDSKVAIDSLLNQANRVAYERLLPGQTPTRQIIYIPTSEVQKIVTALQNDEVWIVIIRSVNNVLLGENSLLVFADVRPNRQILATGQVLASTIVEEDERSLETVNQRLSLLLATARNRANQLGSLNRQVMLDNEVLTALALDLVGRTTPRAALEAFSMEDVDTGDPLRLGIRWLNSPLGDAP
ncbi:MAG: DUF3084 domain-containing protein [Synechococcus sp. SB0665_bin_28]|nr:DUF3084 domain-containing protein [Synechococcus sp. SB0665_bin_28]MYF20341.1 DUF3084 domain-containing protein [Synechococcus sp. SB0677_bin_5]